ncbi:MAG: hypothetical protein H6659_03210 [Ardenticatenaceae bacterium]|nr:hypothetical protein [Ardenticatenaceae bacterium]MCB8986899.1 hypothetical protein [Ardenticatenaceae bacterium]
MTNQTIKIKARPDETIRFPGLCVHCGQPGAAPLRLKKRHGRVTRLIDVPLCAECAQQLARKSGEEERLEKIGWAVAGATAVILLALGLLLTPSGLAFWLRLLLGLVLGLGVGTAVLVYFRRRALQNALPAKQAILQSAQIETFSWRAVTFSFTNETFYERFRALNQPLLMEMSN